MIVHLRLTSFCRSAAYYHHRCCGNFTLYRSLKEAHKGPMLLFLNEEEEDLRQKVREKLRTSAE
jgi:hypothetical protein